MTPVRSRIFGPLLVAAAVTAAAVPASAAQAPPPAPQTFEEEAPPPVPQTYTVDDCPKALSLLTSLLNVLPLGQDLSKAVCSLKTQQRPETENTGPVESTYTSPEGRTVQDNRLLGLPVEWPKSLTVKVPTVNEGTYTYGSAGR
ncbi:hypothetical protein [Actinomadura chokoriensis]|uniref:hypothetical protein n=1 Tax=Actinomadura chokoriensis TaxID=454156 RepID=UPI0031FA2C63